MKKIIKMQDVNNNDSIYILKRIYKYIGCLKHGMSLEGFKLVTVFACEGLEGKIRWRHYFHIFFFFNTVFFAPLAICVIFIYTYSSFFLAQGWGWGSGAWCHLA